MTQSWFQLGCLSSMASCKHASLSTTFFPAERCLKIWADSSSLLPHWQLRVCSASATSRLQFSPPWHQGCSITFPSFSTAPSADASRIQDGSFYKHLICHYTLHIIWGWIQLDSSSLIMPFAHPTGKYSFLHFVNSTLAFEQPHLRLQSK